MFVLQNCRGTSTNKCQSPLFESDAEVGSTFDLPSTGTSTSINESSAKEPDLGDYIIFHATLKGTTAYRHTEDGSLLVQKLCSNISEYPGEDILTLSTVVNNSISKTEGIPGEDVQMCEVSHTLRKRFVVGDSDVGSEDC